MNDINQIIKKLESDGVPYKREKKKAKIYVVNEDKIEIKEELCDVIDILCPSGIVIS